MKLSDKGLKRIIAHWSVTNYDFNTISADHYHFMVNGAGEVKAGKFAPEANIKPSKGNYAAHTLNCNTGSISIACMAMAGAKSVDAVGPYPITERQFESMCKAIAGLCVKYQIAVTPQTVLSHAEVQPVLGIEQRGKWDIAVLPYAGLKTAKHVGDHMRHRVMAYAAAGQPAKPAPAIPAKAPAKPADKPAPSSSEIPNNSLPAPDPAKRPSGLIGGLAAAVMASLAAALIAAQCAMPDFVINWFGYAAKCAGGN